MKYFIGLILIISFASCASKRGRETINNHTKSDSVTIIRLEKQANNLLEIKPDSAIILAQEIRNIVGTSNGTLDFFLRAMFINSNYFGNFIMGKLYVDSANWITSLDSNKGLKYKSDYISGLYSLYIGDPIESATYLFQSLQCQPEPNDSTLIIKTYGTLARIYLEHKDYQKAAKYYLPIINRINFNSLEEEDVVPLLNGYNFFINADSTYSKNSDKCILAAKNYIQSNKIYKYYSNLFYNLSNYFFISNKTDSGIYYANKAIQNMVMNPNYTDRIEKPFFLLIDNSINNKNYLDVINQYEALVKLVDTNKIHVCDKIELFHGLYLAYQKLGNLEKSWYYLGQFELLSRGYKEGDRILGLYKRLSDIDQNYNEIIVNRLSEERNRNQMYIYILLFVLLILSFSSILYLVIKSNKRKIEIQKQKQLKLSEEIQYQQRLYNERCRIAQELHDDLGTTVTSIIMKVEMAKRIPANTQILDYIYNSADEIYNQLNEIIWNLNIKNDNILSLSNFILSFVNSFFAQMPIQIESEVKLKNPDLGIDGHRRRLIFLCIKELMNNIAKHSQASKVSLILQQVDNVFTIEVCDNGIGLLASNENENPYKGGNGIKNIKSQIQNANGIVGWFDNEEGCGCKTIISIFI